MIEAIDLNAVEERAERPQLVQGAYVGTIVNVEYVPLREEDGKGNYINVEWDVTEGPLTQYASNINKAYGWWPLTFSISMKTPWKFKQFIKSLENYKYEANCDNGVWDEHSIEGCDFGISVQMEHYAGNDGTEKTRLKRWGNHIFALPQDVRDNKVKLVEDAYTEELKVLNNAVETLGASTGFVIE